MYIICEEWELVVNRGGLQSGMKSCGQDGKFHKDKRGN